MHKLVVATLLACTIIAGYATCSHAETAEPTKYAVALKACGAEWRASEDRKAAKAAKEDGRKAWNTYRAACVVRQGWVAKR